MGPRRDRRLGRDEAGGRVVGGVGRLGGETATGPTPLTFTPSAPVWVAKSFGAVTVEPAVVHVLLSISAMNASLYGAADVLRELLGEESVVER